MNAYQRGNRDGLLSFATLCDQRASAECAEVERWARARHPQAERIEENHAFAMGAWINAARDARRMAEALPEDPEPAPPALDPSPRPR